jgi:hypothetical protein
MQMISYMPKGIYVTPEKSWATDISCLTAFKLHRDTSIYITLQQQSRSDEILVEIIVS